MVHPSLGPLLVDVGLVTPEQLADAEAARDRTGAPLGAVLMASGAVGRRDLYRTLAAAWNCGYLDVSDAWIDPDLQRYDPATLIRDSWLPLHHDDEGYVVVATAEEPTPERVTMIEKAVGGPVSVGVTADWDLDEAVQRVYRAQILDRAALAVRTVSPVTRRQRIGLAGALLVVLVSLLFATVPTIVALAVLISAGYLVCVLFTFAVCLRGASLERQEAVSAAEVAALDERDLPTFSVLVPVHRAPDAVPDLVGELSALDYPAGKLEIVLLLEEDDDETIDAAHAAEPPASMKFLLVPDAAPKTRAKACNVGLLFARGEHVVVYGAADRPDPDQLKKAVIAFRRAGDGTVCVQAALDYRNAGDTPLTRMLTLEQAFRSDHLLPGLDDLALPVPLGGTSDHFRTGALRDLGGWDPLTAGADPDLGIRAANRGYRVAVVNSTTVEEADRAPGDWVRQRSRWITGYLQALLHHLRDPRALVRAAGIRRAVAFLLLVGGTPATFLCTPLLYLLFATSLVLPAEKVFPAWVLWVSLASLLVGNALMIYVSMMGAFRRRRYALVRWALLNPFYWLLHSIAAYRALWQLLTRPHYWEKTAHGHSTVHSGDPSVAGAELG